MTPFIILLIKRHAVAYRMASLLLGMWQRWLIEWERGIYLLRAWQRGIRAGEMHAQTMAAFKSKLAARGLVWPPQPQGRPLHIVYLSASHSGDWERINMPHELQKLGKATCYFVRDRVNYPFAAMQSHTDWAAARPQVSQAIGDFVQALHANDPVDMVLSYLSGTHISVAAIQRLKALGIPVLAMHLDDRLFFKGPRCGDQWLGMASVCQAYDLNLSNALRSLVKYRVAGGEVLFWPEGANADHFAPRELEFKFDVSFIGARYGLRGPFIDGLRRQGLTVACFGAGWEFGSVSVDEMVNIYAQSRINLGFGYVGFTRDTCLKGRDFEVPSAGAEAAK